MKKVTRKYMLLCLVISTVIGISLVGCSHTPPRPAELDQARLEYAEARDNPQVASRAPVALREAEETLLRAEQIWDKDKDVKEVQNLAAVARQRAELARAAAEQKQAEAELALTRKNIRAEVLDAAAALETAGQRIEAARSGREAAETQLASEKDRYNTGLSTNFLVLTRQNQLSQARLDELSALTDYHAAQIEMARADGSLIEARGIVVEPKNEKRK